MNRLTFRAIALALTLLGGAALGCRAQVAATPAAAVSTRDEFRRLVMGNRKTGDLNVQPVSASDLGKVHIERVRFTPEEGQSAVAVIYRPKEDGKYPAIVFQHFLGGSKDHLLMIPLMNSLAQKGYVVAAIDGRYRGERQNGKSLEAAMLEALRSGKGHPFLIDTTFDVTRLIDLLVTRPEVDAQRIGMTGISEGGIITWMSTFVDDRIKVAVPIIGVTCFGECFNADGPESAARVKMFEPLLKEYAKDQGTEKIDGKLLRSAWEKLVPGMLDRFDAPKVLPLLAPRPVLILSHEKDELFPVDGAQKAFASAQARYRELNVPDRVDFRVAAGLAHGGFNLQEINSLHEWMDRWLKAAPAPAK
jgi:dienelactone hydrolase